MVQQVKIRQPRFNQRYLQSLKSYWRQLIIILTFFDLLAFGAVGYS